MSYADIYFCFTFSLEHEEQLCNSPFQMQPPIYAQVDDHVFG